MKRRGASKHNKNMIRRLAYEGLPVMEIARITGVKPEYVEINLPEDAPKPKVTVKAAATKKASTAAGGAKMGMPPGVKE